MNLNTGLEKTWEEVANQLNGEFTLEENVNRYRLTIEKVMENKTLRIIGIDTNGYNDSGKFFSKAQFIFSNPQSLELQVYKMGLLDRLISTVFYSRSQLHFKNRQLQKKYKAKGTDSHKLEKAINLPSFCEVLLENPYVMTSIKPSDTHQRQESILEIRVFRLLNHPKDIHDLINTCIEMGDVLTV